jgi:hypothetical protein
MLGNAQARSWTGRSAGLGLPVRKWSDARLRGQAGRVLSLLTGRSRRLLELDAFRAAAALSGGRYAGIQVVPISRIRGSEGRSCDFDQDFNPLQSHNAQRWLGVAAARENGVPLPPVDLIQIGDIYFVRDGHHRISVARAFGQEDIEAEVTVWDID